ncbi:hypothetical protein G9A89_015196 [Geosiphon pyriformis]|nr:hypothetical protein G9A89_015196 [Geosiphon pyriformis]
MDASKNALKAVLLQIRLDNKEHPVVYASHSTSPIWNVLLFIGPYRLENITSKENMQDEVLICNNSHSKSITRKDPRTPMPTVCQECHKPNLRPMDTLTYQ